jgi:hypothetical protein
MPGGARQGEAPAQSLIFAGFLSARCIPIFTARRSDVAVETASPDVP